MSLSLYLSRFSREWWVSFLRRTLSDESVLFYKRIMYTPLKSKALHKNYIETDFKSIAYVKVDIIALHKLLIERILGLNSLI